MTATLLEALSRTAYPGRGILLGRSPDGRMLAAAYFITGRSASSQARVLVREEETVWTRPSDPEVMKKGDPELLIYPALILSGGLAVSNGRQTADVAALVASGLSPREILALALEHWDYEPDGPIFTPRISGCATPDGRAALGLVH
ncbi:MAG: hypothetical protein FJY83_07785, partial [Candidatus Aminicenantes bacterium]|nr:hypothetical protein [Candidatus Aminicenantes bacterium]